MSLTIISNAEALRTINTLSRTSNALNHSFGRLASGLRINMAKDDVAGFSISTRMESKIREQNKGIQNVGDAISMTQIADSGLKEGAHIVQRMWELAVQSANDTYNESDRQSLNDEFNQLNTELGRLTMHTTFNGQKLLDEGMIGKKIQVGNEIDPGGTLEWLSVNDAEANLSLRETGYGNWWSDNEPPGLLTQEQAEETLGILGQVIDNIGAQRTRIGAFEARLLAIQDNLSQAVIEHSSARSKIRDADIAQEAVSLTAHTITQNASAAILVQANQQPRLAMQLFG